jgi:hypothetical protein
MEQRGFGPLPQLIEILLVATLLNLVLAWLWMRPIWDDFWIRVLRMLPRRAVA